MTGTANITNVVAVDGVGGKKFCKDMEDYSWNELSVDGSEIVCQKMLRQYYYIVSVQLCC